MPEIEVEIFRTVEITRDESCTVTVDVPQRVIDEDELHYWIVEKLEAVAPNDVKKAVNNTGWEVDDEDEPVIEYTEVHDIS